MQSDHTTWLDCICAPPKRGSYWEIHPRRPRDFLRPERFLEGEARGKSRGRRGWISQYLQSFGGVRTFSHHQSFYKEWIRKTLPVGREGLTVLKSILPCWPISTNLSLFLMTLFFCRSENILVQYFLCHFVILLLWYMNQYKGMKGDMIQYRCNSKNLHISNFLSCWSFWIKGC